MEEPAANVEHSGGIVPLLDRLVERTLCTPIREGRAVSEAAGKIGRAIPAIGSTLPPADPSALESPVREGELPALQGEARYEHA